MNNLHVDQRLRYVVAVLLWAGIIVSMADLDASSPNYAFRSAEWLVGLALCVVVAIQTLEPDRWRANGLTVTFMGAFLLLYNLTWWIVNHQQTGVWVSTVALYPFDVTATWPLWFAMMVVGFLLLVMGLEPLLKRHNISRPG
jgi:hypothetical protein